MFANVSQFNKFVLLYPPGPFLCIAGVSHLAQVQTLRRPDSSGASRATDEELERQRAESKDQGVLSSKRNENEEVHEGEKEALKHRDTNIHVAHGSYFVHLQMRNLSHGMLAMLCK